MKARPELRGIIDVLDQLGKHRTIRYMEFLSQKKKIVSVAATFAILLSILVAWVTYKTVDVQAGIDTTTSQSKELPEFLACAEAQDRMSCMNAATTKIDVSDINVVDQFFVTVNDSRLGPGCFNAAEQLGKAVWARHGLDAFSAGTPACETGYLHGALIAAAESGVGEIELAEGCERAKAAQQVDELWTPSMMLTCLVGVGRALAVNVEDVVTGADICERLLAENMTEEDGKFKAVDFCVRGMVLELINISVPVKDALNQCHSLKGSRADACLSLGLRGPASQSEAAVIELGQECESMEMEHRRYCFFALSDAIATRAVFQKQVVPAETLTICSEEIDCLGHFAKFVLTATWDPQGTIEACKVFDDVAREQCAGSVPSLTDDGIRQGHIPESKRL
jgi:hypothetical protein